MKKKNNWETLFTIEERMRPFRTFPINNITAKRWRLFGDSRVVTGLFILSSIGS